MELENCIPLNRQTRLFGKEGFNVYFGNAKQINPRKNGNNRNHISGQIIATSHDRFPPNGGLVREFPLFQGNLAW